MSPTRRENVCSVSCPGVASSPTSTNCGAACGPLGAGVAGCAGCAGGFVGGFVAPASAVTAVATVTAPASAVTATVVFAASDGLAAAAVCGGGSLCAAEE